MLMEARTGGTDHNMTRKPRWSFKKAVWLAFHDDCETAFAEAGPEPVSEKWFRDLSSQNKLSCQQQNKIFRCVKNFAFCQP